jgi:hypothetical protein
MSTTSKPNRQLIFETVRDYPGLTAVEITELLGKDVAPSGVTSYLTSLFDANLVRRERKQVMSSVNGGRVSSPFHYYTTVAEYRWEHKPRITRAPREPQTPQVVVQPMPPTPPKWTALTTPQPAPPTPPHLQQRWTELLGKDPDPVDSIIDQIKRMPFSDALRLKRKLAEVFA